MNRTKEMLIFEEERGSIPEEFLEKMVSQSVMLRSRLLFLNKSEDGTSAIGIRIRAKEQA